MSGWIKLEKDLMSDPRLMRLARFIKDALTMSVDRTAPEGWEECNGLPLPGETIVLGVLAKLWMIADTHIGEDDILPLGVDEIDDLIGIPGFTEMMPSDWLQVIDSDSVKLPGYHRHNGTIAKERALNQKRVAKSRNKATRATVSIGNGRALPDQDQDLYQDKSKNAPPVPRGTGFDGWQFIEQRMRPNYPRGTYPPTIWMIAARTVERLHIEQGVKLDDIEAGAKRFNASCIADGSVGTRFIVNPDRFLTESRYTLPFEIKSQQPAESPERQRMREAEAREWADLRSRANVSGFRMPGDTESQGAYRTLLQRHEDATRDERKKSTNQTGPASIASLLPTRALA